MPRFRADIEVFFEAESPEVASGFADTIADDIGDWDLLSVFPVHVTAITSGAAPVPEPA